MHQNPSSALGELTVVSPAPAPPEVASPPAAKAGPARPPRLWSDHQVVDTLDGGDQEDTWAAPLLAADRGGAELGARRLAFGALGVACLQAAHTSLLPSLTLSERLWVPVGLDFAAATSLVLNVPGALILLTSLGAAPSWQKAYEGLGRAFFLGGLVCAGFAPLVALFAWTGAGEGPLTGLALLVYAASGVMALTRLTQELSSARQARTVGGLLVLLGFWGFSLFVGAYTWFRLMDGVFG
jgi:hypothetical protein